MPSSHEVTTSAAAAADRAKAADEANMRAERNARAEQAALEKAREALAKKKEEEREELEAAKMLLRPAWNSSTDWASTLTCRWKAKATPTAMTVLGEIANY